MIERSTASHCIGFLDAINNGFIFGWARRRDKSDPPTISVYYQGSLCEKSLADIYRPDLKAAGIGHGRHGFKVAIPCDVLTFNPELLDVRCDDGTLLPRTEEFLGWRRPNTDLLASPVTRTFHLELTSNCNLRCVYCPVSQPWYEGKDMEVADFDELVQMLKARRVRTLVVNGHGETTMIPGWHHKIIVLAAAGFRLSIISNFARLLTEEELGAMARISEIQISVDTHRQEVLRAIRRRVDLGNILINMAGITATASRLSLPKPEFSWSCVVTDQVALDLVNYIRFGLACGVRHFTLCNLTQHDDIKGARNVRHVTSLPDEELKQVSHLLVQTSAIIEKAGGTLTIQAGLIDCIDQELAIRGAA
jgi:Radical SAM superfamily